VYGSLRLRSYHHSLLSTAAGRLATTHAAAASADALHDLRRSPAQTAAGILAERTDAVPVREDVRLVECDYGAWSGRQLSELAREPLWAQVQAHPASVVFPDGEAMADMAVRAVSCVRHWSAQHPEGVVGFVSHGDVIKAVLSDALGQPFDEFQRIVLGPGSLSAVAYGRDRPMVLSMNDTGRRLRVGPHAPAAGPTVGGGDG
jgi:broad specificity phosphatase PhoE